jgi:hypothetical protein
MVATSTGAQEKYLRKQHVLAVTWVFPAGYSRYLAVGGQRW